MSYEPSDSTQPRIVPPEGGASTGDVDPRMVRALQAIMSSQRPAVIAHVRRLRRRSPDASPDEIIRMLEKHYLTLVTASGASVGAAAVVPAVGLAASLTLSGVETVAFLEASALFAQSVTEVHGIAIDDPERAQSLVMALMLGGAGKDLVSQFAKQMTGGAPRTAYWGEIVTKNMPKFLLDSLTDRLRKTFVRRFAVTQGGSVIGRAIPFGIGAVIGGTGNHIMGRKVIQNAREAFGPAPAVWPASLEIDRSVSDAPRPSRREEVRRRALLGPVRRPFAGRGRATSAGADRGVASETEEFEI